jgi:hypothetical protein
MKCNSHDAIYKDMVSERFMTQCTLIIARGEGTPQLNLHYSVGQQSSHNMIVHWLALAFLLCDWFLNLKPFKCWCWLLKQLVYK